MADPLAEAFDVTSILEGSFAQVTDFTISPRYEQVEESLVGETFDQVDQIINGYDFSFNIHELDNASSNLMDLIVNNERNSLPPPTINILATYSRRDPRFPTRSEALVGSVMMLSERGVTGRKEYVGLSWEGKARELIQIRE